MRRGSVVGSWLLDLTADVLRMILTWTSSMEEYQTLVRVVGLFTVLWISVYPLLLLVLPSLKDSTQGNLVNTETKS